MTQVSLGADVEIETLDGVEHLQIEPGTESGAVIRLRGKGVPNINRRGRGDLYVTRARGHADGALSRRSASCWSGSPSFEASRPRSASPRTSSFGARTPERRRRLSARLPRMSDIVFDAECIFCRIAAREIPAEILHESDTVVAFRDPTRRRRCTSC